MSDNPPKKQWHLCSNDAVTELVYDERRNIKTHYDGGPWSSVYAGVDTKEQAIAELGIQPECKECGRMFETTYCEPYKSQMLSRKLCFKCNFWHEYSEDASNPRHFVIGSQHYCLGTGNGGGFGGRKFLIQRIGCEDIIETKDLWAQGVIPEHFRERLPDTATFVERPKPVGHGQGYLG